MWIRPLVAEDAGDSLKLYAPNPYGHAIFKKHHLELIQF